MSKPRKLQDIYQDGVVPDEFKIQWEVMCKEMAEHKRIKNEKEQERQKEDTTKMQKCKDFIKTYVVSNNLIQLEDYRIPTVGVSNVWTKYYYDMITAEIVCISEYSTKITDTLADYRLAAKIKAGVKYMNPPIAGILILSGNVSIYRFSKCSNVEEFHKFAIKNHVLEFALETTIGEVQKKDLSGKFDSCNSEGNSKGKQMASGTFVQKGKTLFYDPE